MKQHKSGIIIFIVIAVLAVAGALFSFLHIKHEESSPFASLSLPHISFSKGRFSVRSAKRKFSSGEYVAKLYVTGVITDSTRYYNQEWILDTIEELENDSGNQAIMLYLNTPGGGVYQSDEVYLALRGYRRRTGRPVYAYVTEMAASGGYYIACAADKIFANRNGLTGSIGVIFGSSLDATELLEKIGVKSKTFHAGRNKNMLNYDEPLTEEQVQIMESIAQEAYAQFTDIVSDGRNMSIERVYELADGRIYSALQAQENGLIDGVCTFDDALDTLFDDYELGDDVRVEDYEYEEKDTFSSWLGNILARATGIDALAPSFEKASLRYPAYYFSW